MKKTVLLVALALTATLLLAACSAGGARDVMTEEKSYGAATAPAEAPAPEYSMDMAAGESLEGGMYTTANTASGGTDAGEKGDLLALTDPDRKLIRRADLSFETTEFEDSLAKLESLCAQFEGYIQESWQSGASLVHGRQQMRNASYTMRIPKKNYASFLGTVGSVGNLVNKSETTEDVTDVYYDTESRLAVLEMRRDRLFDLLEKATDSESIVTFERELSDTLYQIDSFTGQLKKYDGLVDYTTVTVRLEEVVEYTETEPLKATPKSVGERIASSFANSAENIGNFFVSFAVLLVGNILYILLVGAFVAFILFLVVRINRADAAKAKAGAEARAQAMPNAEAHKQEPEQNEEDPK